MSAQNVFSEKTLFTMVNKSYINLGVCLRFVVVVVVLFCFVLFGVSVHDWLVPRYWECSLL